MSGERTIRSRDNPYYKRLLRLASSRRERRKEKKMLLDGEHLVSAYNERFGQPECLILRESGQVFLPGLNAPETVTLPDPLFDALAPTLTPTGIMALAGIPVMPVIRKDFCLLLEDIQDPGNLGALLRTAAAAGVDAVYLSKGCTEAWSPKALRAGQGAHFSVPVREGVDLAAVAVDFPGPVLAAVPAASDILFELDLCGPTAFLFGNEGSGLSSAVMAAAARHVRIPMPGGTESLNVAAAAAVCLFERVRQVGGHGRS
jgi:RNA methyltransferase, TrmH family